MDLASSTRLMRVYWELPKRNRTDGKRRSGSDGMLPFYECYKLVDQVASFTFADIHFVGGMGDPHDTDLLQLVEYATRRRVPTVYTMRSNQLKRETLVALYKAGLSAVSVPLYGSTAESHESFSNELGSFDAAVITVMQARSAGLPVRIDTTFTRANYGDFEKLAELVASLDAAVWNVTIGYGDQLRRSHLELSAEEVERLFRQLFLLTEAAAFKVETSDVRHYRRFLLQNLIKEKKRRINTMLDPSAVSGDVELSVPTFCEVDEREVYRHAEREIVRQRASIFVNADGTVWPDQRLAMTVGHVGHMPLSRVATHPFLLRLRNAEELRGKCSACEFRELCGGSRARAYDATGDPFEGDPLCAYQPARWNKRESTSDRAIENHFEERPHAATI
jgi:AdoMet-dependent heme synthase